MSGYFFNQEDLECFSVQNARTIKPEVIASRKKVVAKLRFLHDNYFEEPLKRDGLFGHWKREHLTNVFFPLDIANGGFVDYIRLGYGKPKQLVDELARRSGVFQELTAYGTYDPIAFYYVAMLQVGLTNMAGGLIIIWMIKPGWSSITC